jgi:tetratricopeptide (TPR) repeat protein
MRLRQRRHRVHVWRRLGAACLVAAAAAPNAQAALDLGALWNFSDPALSEQRFREALKTAQGDEALVLQTQIARSHGLRKDFEQARAVLKAAQPHLAQAGGEAQTRWWLEWGRSWASGTHSAAQRTPDAVQQARQAWEMSLALARQHRLDGLAVDAIHMFAFIDTAPADQLRWGEQALAVVLASQQPAAQRWEASVRHNIGHALFQLDRHAEALAQFEQALVLRERGSNADATHVARWMVARQLRLLNRLPEALAGQQRLAREAALPDPYVFDELALLHRALGQADEATAAEQAAQRARAKP